MPSLTPARITEYHDLVGKIAAVEQMRRWTDADLDDDLDRERRTRAAELADLITKAPDNSVPYDVETHVSRWIETHPLTLTGSTMVKVIRDASRDSEYPGNGMAVAMQIGDPTAGGRYYPLHAGMFVVANGSLRLVIPDAVAEEFRQQGRRALQSELRSALNVSRA